MSGNSRDTVLFLISPNKTHKGFVNTYVCKIKLNCIQSSLMRTKIVFACKEVWIIFEQFWKVTFFSFCSC